MGMARRGLLVLFPLLVKFSLVPVAVADVGSLRLDCGSEAMLEEGACVLSYLDTEVVVSTSGNGSLNTLTVRLADAQSSVSRAIDGIAYRAELADLNVDSRPEVYVSISSAGSGSYGSLAAYVVEADLSLSPILLPELADNADASTGYMGHDQFAVVENNLVRRFPIYQAGDVNAEPTGGTRNLVYRLDRMVKQWQLVLERINDY